MEVTIHKTHFLPTYFAHPNHPITISLIGVGGTGSLLLARLARLQNVLLELGHPGIFVYAYDGDNFEKHNVGRQLCTPMDVGRNKAITMVEKINLNFGLGWEAIPEYYNSKNAFKSNITITCVDNVMVRTDIHNFIQKNKEKGFSPNSYDFRTPFYWLDCGNGKDFGQIVLGSMHAIKQPKRNRNKTVETLKDVIDIYGGLEKFDNEEIQKTRGCSVREALQEQDLYVNDLASVYAARIIKKLFFDIYITSNGVVFNDLQALPIKI